MMGTADELPQAPTEKVKFLEDMTDAELATAVMLCDNKYRHFIMVLILRATIFYLSPIS